MPELSTNEDADNYTRHVMKKKWGKPDWVKTSDLVEDFIRMAVQYNIRKPAFDSLVAVDTGSDETSVRLFDAAVWRWHAKQFVQVGDNVRHKIVTKIQKELDEMRADPDFEPDCAEPEAAAASPNSASASGAKAGEANAGQGSPRDQDNDGRTTPATPLPRESPVEGSVVQSRTSEGLLHRCVGCM